MAPVAPPLLVLLLRDLLACAVFGRVGRRTVLAGDRSAQDDSDPDLLVLRLQDVRPVLVAVHPVPHDQPRRREALGPPGEVLAAGLAVARGYIARLRDPIDKRA